MRGAISNDRPYRDFIEPREGFQISELRTDYGQSGKVFPECPQSRVFGKFTAQLVITGRVSGKRRLVSLMIGEAVVLSHLSTFMPRIQASAGGRYGAFLFAAYALVLGIAEVVALKATP